MFLIQRTCLIMLATLAIASPQGPTTTVKGRIKHFNYGPNGEILGFRMANGTIATIPPELSSQLESLVKEGSTVEVTGYERVGVKKRPLIDVQSIRKNGQTLTVTNPGFADQPSPPPRRARGPRSGGISATPTAPAPVPAPETPPVPAAPAPH